MTAGKQAISEKIPWLWRLSCLHWATRLLNVWRESVLASLQLPITVPPELVLPDYSIYRYTDQIYKVIRHKSTAPRYLTNEQRSKKGYDHKLDPSISRARKTILEYALCNSWDYFCTFTLSPEKNDRFDLDAWHKSFIQWLKDERKKGYDIRYVIVPERHENGAWHAHGLFKGNIDLVSFADLHRAGEFLPEYLYKNGYYNWPAYQKKFGFCSFALIRNTVAVSFYMIKYIRKDLGKHGIDVGKHLLWHSNPLARSVKHGDVYGFCDYLDGFLTNDYDFCATGMTKLRDNLDWTFALEYMMLEPLELSEQAVTPEEIEVDQYMESVQMAMDEIYGVEL